MASNAAISHSFAGYPSRARCAAIHFQTSQTVVQTNFDSLEELSRYLQYSRRASQSSQPYRVLYLLEGMDPDYVAILGATLQVDPAVFARHQRTGFRWSGQKAGDTPHLLSLVDPAYSFNLDYQELLYFPGGFDQYFLRNAESERHIRATSVAGHFEKAAAVQRKASFWARPQDGGGWEGLLILDAPVQDVLVGPLPAVRRVPMYNEPYAGGYEDIIPYVDLNDALKTPGPPRTSIYNDLCHYFTHYAARLEISDKPASATIFLQRIVASHYAILAKYTDQLFEHMYWVLGRQENYANRDVGTWAADLWSDLHTFDRRCRRDLHDLTAIIKQLDYTEKVVSQPSVAKDFLALQQRFEELRAKSQALSTSFTSLTGIVGIKQSLNEARSVYKLTILGVLFLPLSFTSGLFSMSPEYLPGAAKLWIYIIVAIPISTSIIILLSVSPVLIGAVSEVKGRKIAASLSDYEWWRSSGQQVTNATWQEELF